MPFDSQATILFSRVLDDDEQRTAQQAIQPQGMPPGELIPRIVGCVKCARAIHFGISRAVLALGPSTWDVRATCMHCGHSFMVDALKAPSPSY